MKFLLPLAVLLAVVGAGLLFFRPGLPGYRAVYHPCVVEDAVTILCQRSEDDKFIYYKTVATSKGNVIVILRQSKKGGRFLEAKE